MTWRELLERQLSERRALVLAALEMTNGNHKAAAEKLGMQRSSLYLVLNGIPRASGATTEGSAS